MDFVNILLNTVINHDTEIGDYCKLNTMCNLGGSVKVGKILLYWIRYKYKRKINYWRKYFNWHE